MTEEERIERKRAAQRRWYEKQKAKKAGIPYEAPSTTDTRIAEYEKLCRLYKAQAEAAQARLDRATLEYNARVKYMQDAIKHAYLSIQFATNAINETKGVEQND